MYIDISDPTMVVLLGGVPPEEDNEFIIEYTGTIPGGSRLYYEDGKLYADITQDKEEVKANVNYNYSQAMLKLKLEYPDVETATWDKQEREALAYRIDNTAPTPFIDGIVQGRGIDKDELIAKILEKSDALASVTGYYTGVRQALEAQIDAATTYSELQGISFQVAAGLATELD